MIRVNRSELRKEKYVELFYAVIGAYAFPVDMLRYDSSMPASERDANEMQFAYCFHEQKSTENRIVWLRRVVRDGAQLPPTDARWASQGWHVIPTSMQSYTPNDEDRKRTEEMANRLFKRKAS